jgi:poly-gamma-glutamate synthesis protein (capsule biosynthesis protein)
MKILIGADVVPTEQTQRLFVEGATHALFGNIYDLVKSADRLVVNLECALTQSETRIKKFGPCLKADPQCADTLKKLGVTDVMLSNNHVFDFGIQGLKDTMKSLERVGLSYTGVGENDIDSRKPHIVEKDGKTIGFINVCEHEYSYALHDRMGANPYNPYVTMHDIRKLKKQVDYVIVLYHGGKEHCRYPSPRLRLLCREMIENGANVVVTQHSHCIGCYEEYEGGHIVYGQGNFHFCWKNMAESWYTSLLVEISIEDKLKINFIPLITKENGIDIAQGVESIDIMRAFYDRNIELKNGKWQEGWHAFCESVSASYERAANHAEKPDLFAHYLDCEAHTDVWRELFPTWNSTNEK